MLNERSLIAEMMTKEYYSDTNSLAQCSLSILSSPLDHARSTPGMI